jgi:hypothetical protein
MPQRPFLTALCLASIGCASTPSTSEPAAQPAETRQSSGAGASRGGPIGSQLVKEVASSGDQYNVSGNGGKGLGKYEVSRNGKPVWPPEGEGCVALIECCTELAARADQLALSCLLATGRDRHCVAAKKTAVAIADEQGVALPDTCE